MSNNKNASADSPLVNRIKAITAIVVVLTALVSALVKFRDSIPWLTPVSTIEVMPNPVNLTIGDKIQVIATVRDSNKNPLEKKVSWSSANPSLVQIDADGKMTAAAQGETTITASVGPVKALAAVNIRHVNVALVDVFPPATTLLVEDHLKFDATPYDSDGNSLLGRPVRWASENNLVAAVDQSSGDTTGRSAGNVKVTAESEGKLNSAQVTVNPKPTTTPTEQPPAPTPAPAPAPATASPQQPQRAKRARIGAEIGREAAVRAPGAVVLRLPPNLNAASRTMSLAVAEKIAISNGLKFNDCSANIRILIGPTLFDLKSDPQQAGGIPVGEQSYNLHGTVSCPHQVIAVANGHGTVEIANAKTYRCVWHQKGPKDFEITLKPE